MHISLSRFQKCTGYAILEHLEGSNFQNFPRSHPTMVGAPWRILEFRGTLSIFNSNPVLRSPLETLQQFSDIEKSCDENGSYFLAKEILPNDSQKKQVRTSSDMFIVNDRNIHISHVSLVFLLLILNK